MAKASGKNKTIVAGLDIGTSKVVCIIAALTADENQKFDIVGVGTAENTGVRGGVVVNIETTIEAICKAREEAELMAGDSIQEVWLGVAGPHINSFESKGMIAIRNKEVTEDDIDRVIEAAKAVAVPSDREVIHVLPREYKVDGQDGILDPIGMSGVRLESSVHIVTGGQTALQNATKCTEKAGLKVSGIVLQPLASSLSVLSQDEKNLGVALVDIGGGSADIVIYTNGSIGHTATVPVGGQHFTQDVAVGLRTPHASAEILKKKWGSVLPTTVGEDETVEVPGVGGREARAVCRRDLCSILEPRAEETLGLIFDEIEKSELKKFLGSGVVLTGGGSQLDGMVEMGEFLFDVPVRRGAATQVKGLSDIVKLPGYATSMGLIMFGIEDEKLIFVPEGEESPLVNLMGSWTRRMKDLFGGSL